MLRKTPVNSTRLLVLLYLFYGHSTHFFTGNDSGRIGALLSHGHAATKPVGLVDGGWPLKASIAATTKKGNGFAAAAQVGLNHLIENGSYAKIRDRWGLSAEAVQKSELNPAGLPNK